MAELMITFEFGGVPVELITERDIRKAIAAGRLRPDTIVELHGSDGSVVTSRADEITILCAHFGLTEADPSAEAEPEHGVGEPTEVDEARGTLTVPEPPANDRREEQPEWQDGEPEETIAPFIPAAPAAASGSSRPLFLILGGLGVAVLLALISSEGGPPPDFSVNNSAYDSNLAADASEPTAPREREIGIARTFYAVRQVVLRSEPTPRSSELGRLPRGEEIFGTIVRRDDSDQEWVRIDSGTRRGGYIWRGNLGDAMPPTLARAFEERRLVRGPTAIHAGPSSSAATLQTLDEATWVTLAGELDSGWSEVALNNGGVGYLPPEAFSTSPVGSEGRDVWIRNDCSYPIDLRMIYQSRNGEEDNDGGYWTIDPGESIHAMHDRSYIKAVSDDFYYHVTTPTGPWTLDRPRYFNYGNRRIPMERANSIIDESGNYYLRFYCTD